MEVLANWLTRPILRVDSVCLLDSVSRFRRRFSSWLSLVDREHNTTPKERENRASPEITNQQQTRPQMQHTVLRSIARSGQTSLALSPFLRDLS